MSSAKIIVWFRQDLRISDNPALFRACSSGQIIPIFIHDDSGATTRKLGGASKWWLHHSLNTLSNALGTLNFMSGDPFACLMRICEETGARSVFWNRCYEPGTIARDRAIKADLSDNGIEVRTFNASLLHEPWEIETGSGGPYKVFTPYWNTAKNREIKPPLPKPEKVDFAEYSGSVALDELDLLPSNPDWAAGWETLWKPGASSANRRLREFFDNELQGYGTLRDRPDRQNVSRLSPHLHFGEISPRKIFTFIQHQLGSNPAIQTDCTKFLSEIGWREYANHLLFHFPTIPTDNWKPEFDHYPWQEPGNELVAWQKGKTGYPLVDAGMRELWHTGYMHNRVRMVAASFLIKHLGIDWRYGEAWFWDTLLDADLANNCAGWQWVAGSGADASPYFRVFNPTTQAQKFDPQGIYIRRWCPELANLPDDAIHAPFDAPPGLLKSAGVTLGKNYPAPIVDHKFARTRALAGYEAVKASKAGNG